MASRLLLSTVTRPHARRSRVFFKEAVRPPRGTRIRLMGVLNVTPDSFSDGSAYRDPAHAAHQARAMAEAGADVIDIGGESTRPGAKSVPLEEELRRVMPVVRALASRGNLTLSIDTSKAEVARQALACGARIINDVTALRGDPAMAEVIARAKASVILMHMRGTPQTMQRQPRYQDVVADVIEFLGERIAAAERAGIASERIWIDPGLGFGKTVRHNLELLQRVGELRALKKPIVLGPSRKSFIGRVLRREHPQERVNGTLACVAAALEQGVEMVRVHDVEPVAEFVDMWRAIHGPSCG